MAYNIFAGNRIKSGHGEGGKHVIDSPSPLPPHFLFSAYHLFELSCFFFTAPNPFFLSFFFQFENAGWSVIVQPLVTPCGATATAFHFDRVFLVF